jgi:hypothetical protein
MFINVTPTFAAMSMNAGNPSSAPERKRHVARIMKTIEIGRFLHFRFEI